jgi:glucose/arabinose dehydrogenase
LLGPHSAALGMRFYTGKMFPTAYKNQIIVARHGSWNRSKKGRRRRAAGEAEQGRHG